MFKKERDNQHELKKITGEVRCESKNIHLIKINTYNLHLKNRYEKIKKRNIKRCFGLNSDENLCFSLWNSKKTVSYISRQKN